MVSLFVSLRAFPTALSHEATCCEWDAFFCDTPPPAAAGKGKDEKYMPSFTAFAVFSAFRLHWTLCTPTLMHLTCREESRWRSERDLRIQLWVTLNDNSEVNGCQLTSSEFSRGDFTVCVNCVFKWFHSSLCQKIWGLCAASVFHLSGVIKGLYFWNHKKNNNPI